MDRDAAARDIAAMLARVSERERRVIVRIMRLLATGTPTQKKYADQILKLCAEHSTGFRASLDEVEETLTEVETHA